MRVLFDTNVLVAALTLDTGRSETVVTLLDQTDEPLVSVLSLMELRSVLSKKKQFERNRIDTIEDLPEPSESTVIYELSSDTLLNRTIYGEDPTEDNRLL